MAKTHKKEFAKLLTEKLEDRDIDIASLAKKTGISARHISALTTGDESRFPPSPYLQGYLSRLGMLLEFDGEKWWKKISKEINLQHSGEKDLLPKNEFSRHLSSAWRWWALTAIVILLTLGVIRLPRIIGIPNLVISSPNEETTLVGNAKFTVSGIVEYADTLLIGGEQAPINDNGHWQKNIFLQPGMNTIEIHAEKLLGKSVTKVLRVQYKPEPEEDVSATSTNSSFYPDEAYPNSSTSQELGDNNNEEQREQVEESQENEVDNEAGNDFQF